MRVMTMAVAVLVGMIAAHYGETMPGVVGMIISWMGYTCGRIDGYLDNTEQ